MISSAKKLVRQGIESILSPKQQRRPLPSLLYKSSSLNTLFSVWEKTQYYFFERLDFLSLPAFVFLLFVVNQAFLAPSFLLDTLMYLNGKKFKYTVKDSLNILKIQSRDYFLVQFFVITLYPGWIMAPLHSWRLINPSLVNIIN